MRRPLLSRIARGSVVSTSTSSKRTRTSFVRENFGHQEQAIELWKASRREVVYLGEWHSHPETRPSPSSVDVDKWQQVSLETSDGLPLLAIITGTEQLFVVLLRHGNAPVRLSASGQDDTLDTAYVRTRL
ncbi:Mov34/MPN/PAD-1 family protein [Paraburkholderia fungorum]|uniref:Mov34/MPN/PAD-1 family protein n=1 Tax=Paraburkholderia fungorum TaxID=134537 RepID=UPI001C1EBE18|nr:Mov34/MPN/PAD-1 family protein [Paraburkholderia fungorum]